MPEGHKIHRIANDLSQCLVGQTLTVSSPQGRFEAESKLLDGNRLVKVFAHGKHLFCEWDSKDFLHIHLGLYGKFRFHKMPVPEPRGQVRVRLVGESHGVDLNGPNQCQLISQKALDAKLSQLGEDPLNPDAEFNTVWDRISRSRASIGSLLLNQKVIAGVGNIYRAEVLYHCGISPGRQGRQLTETECLRVWETLRNWMQIGVQYNRIITTDFKRNGKSLSRLKKEEALLIYKKEFCERCGIKVSVTDCANRKIYYCPVCQDY